MTARHAYSDWYRHLIAKINHGRISSKYVSTRNMLKVARLR